LAIQAMQHNIERFNESLLGQGLPELRIRIGIASGDVLVGDLGTRYRATYTAVGSCINTAARLENKAKELQFSVLANEMFAQSIEFKGCTSIGMHDLRGIGSVAVYCVANT
jgi:adenylate cyclase